MTETTAAQPAAVPALQALDIVLGYFRASAFSTAAQLEIADHLAGGPLHVDELAKRTKTQAPYLFRLLRALETMEVFKQVSPRVFANTPISEVLRKDVPGSFWAGTMDILSPGCGEFEAWHGLTENVRTGKVAFDQKYGYNFWEFLKRDPARALLFNESMRSNHAPVTPVITGAYDWSRFPVIADIGGGIGTQITDIVNAFRRCRGIVFDLPEGFKGAAPHDRVEYVAGNFFERVPPGADAYLLRSIIHDWDDADSLAILKSVRAAAKPGARLILAERVITDEPKSMVSKWIDVHMMVVCGGKERTADEHRELLARAGFEMEQIIPTPSIFSLIFAKPKA